jgi:hypothetical protein
VQERVTASGAQYAQGDGLGSVRLVTNASGTSAATASYDPWGTPKAGATTLAGFGFAGEQTDPESGLAYLRARTYARPHNCLPTGHLMAQFLVVMFFPVCDLVIINHADLSLYLRRALFTKMSQPCHRIVSRGR